MLIGLDVGSTTVKAVVIDRATDRLLWKSYERHETRQPEKTLEFLQRIRASFPDVAESEWRIFMTGSGAGPLCKIVGARFVQEVNAVTMAVERAYPDTGSVVELGGQDAKIIVFQDDEVSGERRAITSMNDKCASGTGATIDKCLVKVGFPADRLNEITFDPSRLHHVAAKCGVFAETDVTNLIKAGLPAEEVLNSLADAIVNQNLSVLTRGNTLRSRVLLLGGPNTFLPFLQECWRHRIPETWEQRGYVFDQSCPIDELIVVPEDAEYFAACGAILFGRIEFVKIEPVTFNGVGGLEEYCATGRTSRLAAASGPALFKSADEIPPFLDEFEVPIFEPPVFRRGEIVHAAIGLDAGSTSTKAVLVDENEEVIRKAYRLSGGNPIQDTKELLSELKESIMQQGAELRVLGFGATGYAAPVLSKTLCGDVNIVETVAHMMSALTYFPDAHVICDIGGQDIKVLFMQNGDIKDFKLSNQCSAGNGMLLQSMADQFAIPVTEYAETAFKATLTPVFSYGCAVFLDTDRVNFQREGFSKEELLAGLALVLPKNIWQYVVGVPRLAELGRNFVLQGGTQKNLAAVKSQVDYIQSRISGARINVHPHCGEAGALGAAMETLRVVRKRGNSSFIGLDEAINLQYTTRNDVGTRCTACTNKCTRTFIDTVAADGETVRYIAGFSCEKGTVANKEALKVITHKRKQLRQQFPNMAEIEAELAFKHTDEPEPLPAAGSLIDDVVVRSNWFGNIRRLPVSREFVRSPKLAAEHRRGLRIGIPRVLSLFTVAPMFRAYFETLGVPKNQLVWSDPTTEKMFAEGSKYGSVDPCFPGKVVQAHFHNLFFEKHTSTRTGPLDYLFFPAVTHTPSFMPGVVDYLSCTVVAGTPMVMRAAFTKELDFFARANIDYVDTSLNLSEPFLMSEQLWQAWGERLKITRDEHEFALNCGWQALQRFDRMLEDEGRTILDQVEREGRMAVLLLGRPYHADTGINHSIPEELQTLGYPILTIRSIPKDPGWLKRWFADDLRDGHIDDIFDIRDVWPENYSVNSAQKIWGAKFAARHSNVAVLDLSSFKCGHDAPTYGLMDAILKAAGTPRLIMHDLDANKAVGSIAIRTGTFAYTLSRHAEELQRKTAEDLHVSAIH
ncbi:MAG: acyl-CoA dehydratase activase-related protein [Gammaproteobacteria bacterium]|nr:acyl-CoA dehydratase activase-related protein [Gammaproteobacteria bacterium]